MELLSDPTILSLIGATLVFVTFALLTYAFVPEEVEEDEIYGYRLTKRKRLLEEGGLYKLTLPLVKIFAHYFRMVPNDEDNWIEKQRRKLRDLLPRSGYMGAYTPNEFFGSCCTSAIGMFAALMVLTMMLSGVPNVGLSAIVGLVGLYLPVMNLRGAITNRLIEIERRLPYTIDLIVLSMRAGLDFMTALDRVVTRGKEQNPDDPMIQELGVVLQEMRVGTPKTEALLNLCERVPSDYLDSMVGSIIQSEKRGSPLAQVLEIQVDTIREKRTQKIEKKASQAAVKILMPLMFIFGSVMVVILGMMILRIQGAQ